MEISKELKADIDANQILLKTAIRNHQVSFLYIVEIVFTSRHLYMCILCFHEIKRDGTMVT